MLFYFSLILLITQLVCYVIIMPIACNLDMLREFYDYYYSILSLIPFSSSSSSSSSFSSLNSNSNPNLESNPNLDGNHNSGNNSDGNPFSSSPNLDNNPFIDQIKTKIKLILSTTSVNHELFSYVFERIERDSKELVKELNLSKYLDKSLDPIFRASLPKGFTSMFAFKNIPGIYLFISKDSLSSYIGSTVDLYMRCSFYYINFKIINLVKTDFFIINSIDLIL